MKQVILYCTNVQNFSHHKTRKSLLQKQNVSLDGASGINGLRSFMGL